MVDDPQPHGPMDEAAIAMHELFSSFRRAGFTRSEALTIIAKTAAEIIATQAGEASKEDE